MKISFLDKLYMNDGFDCLCCPLCGYECLHQTSVEVIFRDGEDQDGTLTESGVGETKIRRLKSEEIMGRRDVILIGFWCEGCSQDEEYSKASQLPKLIIQQHKGGTHISWDEESIKEALG